MCYKEEVLQEIIDREYAGNVDEVLEHINTCSKCKSTFEALKEQDEFVEKALQTNMAIPPRSSIDLSLNENKRRFFEMNKKAKKWGTIAASIVLCSGLFLAEPVRGAAQDILNMFRVQEVKSLSISGSDIREIGDLFEKGKGAKELGEFGKFEIASQEEIYSFENIKGPEEIKEKVPHAKLLNLPSDFRYVYGAYNPKTDVTMTLDVKKINDLLTYLGEKAKLPEGIDNKPFTLHTSNNLSYSVTKNTENINRREKYISVVQMDAPTLEIPENVSQKELIDALFSASFLPENLKNQLMGIGDLTSTLPVPYDEEREISKEISIHGQKGILIENKDQKDYSGFRLCFKENNTVYFIEGDIPFEEALSYIENMQ